jgi:hypothetical protein
MMREIRAFRVHRSAFRDPPGRQEQAQERAQAQEQPAVRRVPGAEVVQRPRVRRRELRPLPWQPIRAEAERPAKAQSTAAGAASNDLMAASCPRRWFDNPLKLPMPDRGRPNRYSATGASSS